MAGVILSISVESKNAEAALSGIQARLKDLSPAMKVIAGIMESSVRKNFYSGGRPKKWPASIRVKAEGGRTLIKTGSLASSIKSQAFPDAVEVGTSLIYGAIHQFGGVIRAKRKPYLKFKIARRWISRKSVSIPARPYLMVQDEDLQEIRGILAGYLSRGIGMTKEVLSEF